MSAEPDASLGMRTEVLAGEEPFDPANGPDGLLTDRPVVEVRFGGSGGQGVILMGIILAVAATRDHWHVVNTQSYGPEARGGFSRSDVIVSRYKIDYPELMGIDLLVALSDEAAHHYATLLRRGSVFLYDSSTVPDPPETPGERFGAPFAELALEATGRAQTTNMLALGAAVGLTGIVKAESLEKAAISMVPAGSGEVNLRAIRRGLRLPVEDWVR